MALMLVLAVLVGVGAVLTVRWGAADYVTWRPSAAARDEGGAPNVPSLAEAARMYLRGVAVALVAGFWTGALVTGPAVRLIMRLLAVTGGADAQGRLTEAEEVIGRIDLGGTIGLWLFGGILPGLLSGFVYVVIRRWLPAGRMGGVVFGLFHLVLLATRIDPLRPDNVDFALVGPGWLSVLTYGAAAVVHGMTVAAIANHYSRSFPGGLAPRQPTFTRLVTAAILVPPVLLLIPGAFLLVPIAAGLVFALGFLRLRKAEALRRDPRILRIGRIVAVAVAAAYLPFTVIDLASIASEPQVVQPRPPSGAGR